MSQSFSRRTFLKYSAAAAVAVAGTSLLGGCSSGEDHTQTGTNTSNTVLKIKTTLNSAVYDAAAQTLTFDIKVENGRVSAVNVNPTKFYILANDYAAYADSSKITVIPTGDTASSIVARGKTGTFQVVASGVAPVSATDTVTFRFFPDPAEYGEYSVTWQLPGDKITVPAGGSGREPGSEEGNSEL